MDLTKSRKSKNVIDTRNVGRTAENTRLRAKTPIKRAKPTETDRLIGMIANPGYKRSISKGTVSDPAPQKLKSTLGKKSGRGGKTRPPQIRKNRNYNGPKKGST